MRFSFLSLLSSSALLVLASQSDAQLTDLQPGQNFPGTGSAQFGTGRSENVDVGDADNDGDLDVIIANGGDGSPQANRIYINNGSGSFTDGTGARFAGVPNDTSRDIEFMDHDNDGDLDIYVSNRGNTSNGGEVSRFYVNLGGLQAGTAGFYQEDSNARWGSLTSVPLGDQVFGGNAGPWRDFSCDCEFADLDDDGDLDLFHSSYGPNINGTRDSRVFLNDGTGQFDELWPWINAGADIKTHTLDLDVVDFDGDLDLDVFMSSRDSQARVFMNNLYNPTGSEPFRDITQLALINQGAVLSGSNNYEAEPADLDGDGDFDVWAKNYNGNTDRILRNDGPTAGGWTFTQVNSWIKGDPVVDENEVDLGDFDSDGDLDAFSANFSGQNWLYQGGVAQGLTGGTGLYHRTGGGAGSLAAGFVEMPVGSPNSQTSLDGEWADMDGDGDQDILVANDANGQNRFFRNALGVPDTHAPTFFQVENISSASAGQSVVIHAQARDNAPYYLHSYYDADLVYSVNGGGDVTVDMFSQGGQQYRGVIPPQSGNVAYHVEVTDLAGNTGVSSTFNYTQGGGNPWTDLGFGLAGVSGIPSLVGTGDLTTGSAGTLNLTNAATGALANLFVSFSSTPAPFKGGTLVPIPIAFQLVLFTNGSGDIPLGWGAWPGGLSGSSLYFQYAISDGAAVAGVSLSNALRADVP